MFWGSDASFSETTVWTALACRARGDGGSWSTGDETDAPEPALPTSSTPWQPPPTGSSRSRTDTSHTAPNPHATEADTEQGEPERACSPPPSAVRRDCNAVRQQTSGPSSDCSQPPTRSAPPAAPNQTFLVSISEALMGGVSGNSALTPPGSPTRAVPPASAPAATPSSATSYSQNYSFLQKPSSTGVLGNTTTAAANKTGKVTTVRSMMRNQTHPRSRYRRRPCAGSLAHDCKPGVTAGGRGLAMRSRSQTQARRYMGLAALGPTPEDEEIEGDGPYSWSGPHMHAPFSGSFGEGPRGGPHFSEAVAEGAEDAEAPQAAPRAVAGSKEQFVKPLEAERHRWRLPPFPRHTFLPREPSPSSAPVASLGPNKLGGQTIQVQQSPATPSGHADPPLPVGKLSSRQAQYSPFPGSPEQETVSSLATLAIESRGGSSTSPQPPNMLWGGASRSPSHSPLRAPLPSKAGPMRTQLSSLGQASFGSSLPWTASRADALPTVAPSSHASDTSGEASREASERVPADPLSPHPASSPPPEPFMSRLSFLSGGHTTSVSDGVTLTESLTPKFSLDTPPRQGHSGSPVAATVSMATTLGSGSLPADLAVPCVSILGSMVGLTALDRHQFVPRPQTPPNRRPEIPALCSDSLGSACASTLQPTSVMSVGTHGSVATSAKCSPAKPTGSLLRVLGSSLRRDHRREHASPVRVGQTATMASSLGGINSVADSLGPPSMFLPGPPFRGGLPAQVPPCLHPPCELALVDEKRVQMHLYEISNQIRHMLLPIFGSLCKKAPCMSLQRSDVPSQK
jgi:hypothetical protein